MPIFEMRTYTAIPGMLPGLLRRMENQTLDVFERHEIKPAAFFTTYVGQSNMDLRWFIRWENLAEREHKWAAFLGDEDWRREREQSEVNGQFVSNVANEFLVPTSFSPLR